MSDENEIDLMMATPEQLRQTALYKTSPERIGLAIGDELEDWDSEFSDSVGDCVTWFAGEDPPVQVSIGYVRADLYDRLRAELAKVREQKPVEWRVSSGGTTRRLTSQIAVDAHRAEGYECTPLYAAPVAAPAVPAAWASPNVLPLRGNRDNHPAILTATKCSANTVPIYLEPPVAAPAVPMGILVNIRDGHVYTIALEQSPCIHARRLPAGSEGGRNVSDKTEVSISGTPIQVGQKVFEKCVAPTLRILNDKPESEKGQFYVGLISSCFGAMAADIGFKNAGEIISCLAAELSLVASDDAARKPRLTVVSTDAQSAGKGVE